MAEIAEVLLRTLGSFLAILILTRLLNKEQVGQLTFYEYVTGITIGSMAGTIAIDTEVKFLPDLLGLVLWCFLTYMMGYLSLVSRPARKLLEGQPTIVVHNGKILEENMAKLRYNVDDLLMQLRNKNAFNLHDVEFAVLEPNGQLSVLLKSQKRPVTPEDLGLPTQYEGMSWDLISDGEILKENLQKINLTEQWLRDELGKRGIFDLREVLYAGIDSRGSLYIDKKKDH
ncbi:Uncharacterized membrane protein YcaP, DUF421 family [Carboxydocella sporoproducens DSM 16521]|uniref:Uncharacterized membrane protein YcaP, DUF421 family n=2 Tax=Carboxydocella TaxID=178898 RepID=A0A1T4S561_9FIRM|nr:MULTISPECIES: DUF421 domain-containing protein [Carboxydocella]AVX21515.1 Uncharacterized membrane protein YcaP, DUF421 family [Carboxydocella thermautotrophica]AVX31995.1 Uncharacterized membrane protein YcaP, DUF421 family [Carboxydocella thermautotrophica]SKA23342.1 Uncharacterized membrane protein YcaP, DUF421 family [Carboxydocella sporoproducens DSM 16521]